MVSLTHEQIQKAKAVQEKHGNTMVPLLLGSEFSETGTGFYGPQPPTSERGSS